ncbi:WXG100 family type VII secretion target [Actinocorallia populi]|uniref:WXG100 family type VII secretion target n=1 Tax=Actinocorallia populi TaxID=2079200 RepID=UPI000D08C03D|nr:hypothetical protein [Actinocorallia populi]
MAPKEPAPVPPGVQAVGGELSLGVDIHGLAALAGRLYGYVPPSEEVVEAIEQSVKKLVTDAGWKGDDANGFQDAWGEDASDAKKLSMFIDDVAHELDQLATSLSELQLAVNDRAGEFKDKAAAAKDDDPFASQNADNEAYRIWIDGFHQARKLQEECAKRLVGLYSGNGDGWSVMNTTKSLSDDKNLSKDLRDRLNHVEDELDDGLPDDDFDWTGFAGWVGGGAGIGAAIGAPFAGVGALPGAALGGLIGLGAGVVVGGGGWLVDQIDDWF